MLKPYSLESPPPVPSLDGDWEGATAFRPGRRLRPTGEGFGFPGSATLSALKVQGGVERRFAALEEPCFIWEVTGAGAVALECTIRLPANDLHFERAGDGTRIWLGAGLTRAECLIDAVGGVATVTDAGKGVLLSITGRERIRAVFIGAVDEADRESALRAIARKGFGGLQHHWRRHEDQLGALRLVVRTPDGAADRLVAGAVAEIDASIVEEGGGAPSARCSQMVRPSSRRDSASRCATSSVRGSPRSTASGSSRATRSGSGSMIS